MNMKLFMSNVFLGPCVNVKYGELYIPDLFHENKPYAF